MFKRAMKMTNKEFTSSTVAGHKYVALYKVGQSDKLCKSVT